MQIQSTHRHRLERPSTGALTPKGKLDQELAAGIQDVVDLGRSRTKLSRSSVQREFGFTALHYGVLGGAFGLAVSNISPIGGLAGLGVGTYLAWNKTARKSSGKVEIKLDGEARTTRYYGRPENYTKTPQEVRAEMISRGELGERIKSYSPDSVSSDPPPAVSASEKKSLKQLAEQRRLVADFGQRSEYGYEVLNQVDSLTAARLMEADKPVYKLEGKSQDTKHTLEVVAKNNRSTVRRHDSDSYIERTYDYSLTPLSKDSLQADPKSEGLPEGFHGVYKDRQTCALILGEDEQAGLGISEKKSNKTSFNSRRVTRDQNLNLGSGEKARVVTTASVNVRDLVTMGGVVVGMLSGMNIAPGIPHAALIGGAAGGVIGRELGWLAQDRMPSFRTS